MKTSDETKIKIGGVGTVPNFITLERQRILRVHLLFLRKDFFHKPVDLSVIFTIENDAATFQAMRAWWNKTLEK